MSVHHSHTEMRSFYQHMDYAPGVFLQRQFLDSIKVRVSCLTESPVSSGRYKKSSSVWVSHSPREGEAHSETFDSY